MATPEQIIALEAFDGGQRVISCDNLAATFSPALADITIYVIEVAAGDKIPGKDGPGITRADLLVINKTDLAPLVGASLEIIEADTRRMRAGRPFLFTSFRRAEGADSVAGFIVSQGGLPAAKPEVRGGGQPDPDQRDTTNGTRLRVTQTRSTQDRLNSPTPCVIEAEGQRTCRKDGRQMMTTEMAQTAHADTPLMFRGGQMKAARILRFGPPNVIMNDDLPRPEPAAGQLLVRVKAAGVGNWDALVREGKISHEPLPLVLGYELSGVVEATGAEVSGFKAGDEVYGATNEHLTGAYAEYAVPSATMMAHKPKTLTFIEAASAPVVTVTAWQMLFEYARVTAGQTVLIHGGAGNVGAYAVQLARQAGLYVVATAAAADLDYARGLGAARVVDYHTERFEESVTGVDAVLDTVGGDTQQRSLRVLKPGGILVSVVSSVSETAQERYGVRAAYFYVDVSTARLNKIAELFDSGKLVTNVGTVLPLEEARIAHEMLGGAPHKRGKIVLSIAA